jgi:pimeloyl-ACP methyl ester carboxylesterase
MIPFPISAAAPAAVDPVVLLPCSAGSARQWQALAEQLTDFQALPVELYGHGNRGRWSGAGPLSLTAEAAIIAELCPGNEAIHLVGHSYGGGVALEFARSFPQRLRSLTLIEPSCFHLLQMAEGSEAKLLDEVRSVAHAVNCGVLSGDYRAGMATFIDYWGGAGSWRGLPEQKQAQMAQMAVHVAHHFWSLIEARTPLSAYAGMSVPTLILCGTQSPAPSRAVTRLLANTLPRARHLTIPFVGHMSPITHPAEINSHILQHLQANRTRSEAELQAHIGLARGAVFAA